MRDFPEIRPEPGFERDAGPVTPDGYRVLFRSCVHVDKKGAEPAYDPAALSAPARPQLAAQGTAAPGMEPGKDAAKA